MHPASPGEGTSRGTLQTSRKICGSTTVGVDPTRSLEACATPPEAVSTASPSSPQFLEQEERPSNRRARETCSIQTFENAVSALRSTEFSPVDPVPIKFRASEFTTILRTKSPRGLLGHRPSPLCQLAKPILTKPTLGIFPDFCQLGATDFKSFSVSVLRLTLSSQPLKPEP